CRSLTLTQRRKSSGRSFSSTFPGKTPENSFSCKAVPSSVAHHTATLGRFPMQGKVSFMSLKTFFLCRKDPREEGACLQRQCGLELTKHVNRSDRYCVDAVHQAFGEAMSQTKAKAKDCLNENPMWDEESLPPPKPGVAPVGFSGILQDVRAVAPA